jgi:SAM-dependent methyltransferase/GNAT superfamily N-acetyltransferase
MACSPLQAFGMMSAPPIPGARVYIRVQQAVQPGDRDEVFRFRYRVQVAEMGLDPTDADHARYHIRDGLDDVARILVAVDESTGAILGTLRALFGCDAPFPQALVEELDLSSMIVAFGDQAMCHSGMFMVDPAYRGQTVASQLIAGLVQAMLEAGVEIDTCHKDLSQARSWFQLGYRPYGPIAPAPVSGEMRVPLALVLRDRAYLERAASPVVRLLAPHEPDRAPMAQRLRELYPHFEDQQVTPQRLGAFWASVAHDTGAAAGASVFEGIPQARLDALLRELPTVRVGAERALPAGDGEALGLILRGRLGLTMEVGERPFYVSVLQPGEVYGALGALHTTPPGARLVALEDTELLELPAATLRSLESSEPELTARLRANLGRILAGRLDATNRQVAGFMRGSPERVPLADAGEPSQPERAQQTTGPSRPASVQQLEAEVLLELGLPEAGTLLELGAGEGRTSLLLARLFPEARVVAVDADPERLALAETLATQAGLDEHCTFLPGKPDRVPLEYDTVDAAVARLLLQRLADPGAALAELHRVLRPGGTLVLLDIDDGGLMVHPAPTGLRGLLDRVAQQRARRGGDRQVGRKLSELLLLAGFEGIHTRVIPLTPAELPIEELCELAFAHQATLLGNLSPQEQRCLQALHDLHHQPGAWLCLPVIVAQGSVPDVPAIF